MSVYWQGVRSKEWHACRDIRQGGILSAYSTREGVVPRRLFKMNSRTRRKDHITV